MATLCKLINATTWWVLNKDSDIQILATSIINAWVIADAWTWNLEVTAWQVASWKCFISVTRTNTTPTETFLVYVWNQQNEAITIWSNKKVFIKVPLDNINDNTLNTSPTGSWIATIVVDTAYPATDYYIALAETDWAWVITDVRTFATIEWSKIDSITPAQVIGWNWKVFYTNWSWITTELALWAATKVLTSNGTTSAPTFESPTIDINWLTESTSDIASDDMLVMYEKSVTANRKHLAKASVTNEWLVELCTDAEATTWSDETRYINSKQAKDNYGNYTRVASDTLKTSNDASKNGADSAPYSETKAITLCYFEETWTIRVKFDLATSLNTYTVYGKIYKNWVAIWTERTNNSTVAATFSEDIAVSHGDRISIYTNRWWASPLNAVVTNFRLYYDLAITPKADTNTVT